MGSSVPLWLICSVFLFFFPAPRLFAGPDPLLIYVLFSIHRIFIQQGAAAAAAERRLPCWLYFRPFGFHSQGSIKLFFSRLATPSAAPVPPRARGEAQSQRFGFSFSGFRAEPEFGRDQASRSHPDWGEFASHHFFAQKFQVSRAEPHEPQDGDLPESWGRSLFKQIKREENVMKLFLLLMTSTYIYASYSHVSRLLSC